MGCKRKIPRFRIKYGITNKKIWGCLRFKPPDDARVGTGRIDIRKGGVWG